ncbi:MAG: RNA methyltransferase [Actinomycetota bacterium]
MHLVPVADRLDPRLRDFLDLRDTQQRAAREPAEGFFLAEGEVTIRRALAAGYEPRSVLSTDRWIASLDDLDVTAYVVPEDVLEATTGYPVHRGALASFARRPLPSVGEVLDGARRAVILQDLVDHANVGAIVRSAGALGWNAVLVTPRCADPLYRRAVRTSMGAVFAVPWTRIDDGTGIADLHEAGFAVAALTPALDAVAIDALEVPERLAVAVGSEGPGLSSRWLATADLRVRIPMYGAVDSLNVATAAAIALYALG